ncbi:ABC transporter substrate-binding protein [Streptomyces sp. NBC_01198]|uniref:ABC transporter substrate-binding protein n=1 Tax=Streptomyces sp. NBC_01198 TaxID=2903769 RepID=UPI002E0D66F8|nr:ABC transporter substrate-binding protein [Streptomyces sp. NBC_01198]
MLRKLFAVPAVIGLAAPLLLAGCDSGSGSGGDGGGALVVGTTDTVTASAGNPAPLDPAAGYDTGSWTLIGNTYQTLVRLPRTGTEPQPDAARTCGFTDTLGEQYRCTLRGGLTFSDGRPLTAHDVKFSVDRMLAIHDPGGPAALLSDIDKVETPDDSTVVFHLKDPDATFPLKLTTPAAAIVDSREYASGKLHPGYRVTGSGPYTLKSLVPGDRAVLVRNPRYKGSATLHNSRVELRFFSSSAAMEKALKAGTIDVMSRTMTPDQISRYTQGADPQVKLTEAAGTQTNFLVFDPADPVAGQQAVRRAAAALVDRQALTRDVYRRTTDPLYSIVPQGITGHTNAFYDPALPDLQRARQLLTSARLTTPVALTLSYSTTHYGEATAAEFAALKRQLENGGLFRVALQGVPDWNTYRAGYQAHRYQVYGLGWYPDFPDPDNYLAPLFGPGGSLGPAATTPALQQLIAGSRQQPKRADAAADLEQAQRLVADGATVLPLWQGKQYLAARDAIGGTEWAMNASSVTQFWELGRGQSD